MTDDGRERLSAHVLLLGTLRELDGELCRRTQLTQA